MLPIQPSKRNISSSYRTSATKFVSTSDVVIVTGNSKSTPVSIAAFASCALTIAGTIGFESEISIVADFGSVILTA